MYRRRSSIYDPQTYPEGVPNPLGPRVHAWTGGPLNEGTRYHGPVYTRPMQRVNYAATPLWGLGDSMYRSLGFPQNPCQCGFFNRGNGCEPMPPGYGSGTQCAGSANDDPVCLPGYRWANDGKWNCVSSGGSPATPAVSYPWGKFSQDTQNLQVYLNGVLDPLGYQQIPEDGSLGPLTCGASKTVGHTPPSTCQSYTYPKQVKCGDHSFIDYTGKCVCEGGYELVNPSDPNNKNCKKIGSVAPVPPAPAPSPSPTPDPAPEVKPSKAGMYLGIAALLLVGAAGVGYIAYSKNKRR